MFFGVDTAFALYAIITGATAALTVVAQDEEARSPSCGAPADAWAAIDRLGIDRNSFKALAIIDFSRPSYLPRMAIYSGQTCRPSHYFCAHGRNTGHIYACDFSNRAGSHQTSLGLYRVGPVYRGEWGTAVKLDGLEPGLNDRARDRSIVLHAAWYCHPDVIYQNIAEGCGPRLGRSQGCPAVPEADLSEVISRLPMGSYLYIQGAP